jgi:hypothetical protein
MLERLSALRLERLETTRKIEKIAAHGNKAPTLEEILPSGEAISIEILSLSDQLMALTERMNRQNAYNQKLAREGESMRYSHPQAQPDQRTKRKASIATIQIKK